MSNVAVHIQNAIQKVLKEQIGLIPKNCCICIRDDGCLMFKFENEDDLRVFAMLHELYLVDSYTRSEFKQSCTGNYVKT